MYFNFCTTTKNLSFDVIVSSLWCQPRQSGCLRAEPHWPPCLPVCFNPCKERWLMHHTLSSSFWRQLGLMSVSYKPSFPFTLVRHLVEDVGTPFHRCRQSPLCQCPLVCHLWELLFDSRLLWWCSGCETDTSRNVPCCSKWLRTVGKAAFRCHLLQCA